MIFRSNTSRAIKVLKKNPVRRELTSTLRNFITELLPRNFTGFKRNGGKMGEMGTVPISHPYFQVDPAWAIGIR